MPLYVQETTTAQLRSHFCFPGRLVILNEDRIKSDFADILENFLTAGNLVALLGRRAYSHSEKRKLKPQQGQFLCTTALLREGHATYQSQEIPRITVVSSAVALRGAYLVSKTMGFFDIADLSC